MTPSTDGDLGKRGEDAHAEPDDAARERRRLAGTIALASVPFGLAGGLMLSVHGIIQIIGAVLLLFAVLGLLRAVMVVLGLDSHQP